MIEHVCLRADFQEKPEIASADRKLFKEAKFGESLNCGDLVSPPQEATIGNQVVLQVLCLPIEYPGQC